MNPRKVWCILVDDDNFYTTIKDIPYGYVTHNTHPDALAVCFTLEDANEYAKEKAKQYPGRDVYVFEQSHGMISPKAPVQTKIWKDNGDYVPS